MLSASPVQVRDWLYLNRHKDNIPKLKLEVFNTVMIEMKEITILGPSIKFEPLISCQQNFPVLYIK